jgi:hypothetical protein
VSRDRCRGVHGLTRGASSRGPGSSSRGLLDVVAETLAEDYCRGGRVTLRSVLGPCRRGLVKGVLPQGPCHRNLVTEALPRGSSLRGRVATTLSQGPCHRDLVTGSMSRGSCRRELVAGASSQGPCHGDLLKRTFLKRAPQGFRRGAPGRHPATRHRRRTARGMPVFSGRCDPEPPKCDVE